MKGLDTFIKLSKELPNNTIIVLVGLTNRQIKKLPKNIVGITRTDNQEDLVKLYSISDLFVNPTLEDNYPTVNIEAIACGIPVITYNTGGCNEQIKGKVGYVCNNYQELIDKIKLCIEKNYKKNEFNNKEIINKIKFEKCYLEYLKLFNGR